ncbi:MAG: SUMF1/EgtB/PvdO family nonheme iron enzyme [Acidobacteriota bacterium]
MTTSSSDPDQLQRELEALRAQLAAKEAQLAAATDTASLRTGDVERATVIVGDGNTVQAPSTADDGPDPLRHHCRHLAAEVRRLPLSRIDRASADATHERECRQLENVYVDLDAVGRPASKEPFDSPEEREDEPTTTPLLQLAAEFPRLVLLGDPGGGKTTFLNHLALCLAGGHLHDSGAWRERLTGWSDELTSLVPVRVLLRDLHRFLGEGETADASDVLRYLESRCAKAGHPEAHSFLRKALDEDSVLLLLDGLDEVPTQAGRRRLSQAVEHLAETYGGCRFLVTCRTLSYEKGSARLPGWPTAQVAPLDREKVGRFVRGWYADLAERGELATELATERGDQLARAVRRPDHWKLATNPLLLTVMALVHAVDGRLPKERARLYEKAIEVLLWMWEEEKAKEDGEAGESVMTITGLLERAGRNQPMLLKTLEGLAFSIHAEADSASSGEDGAEAVADIPTARLSAALATLEPEDDPAWLPEMLTALSERAGLLLQRDEGVHAFPHRTFQEYLAAAHLSRQGDFATRARDLVREDWSTWRVATLLAVGRLVHLEGEIDKPVLLAEVLCSGAEPADEVAWRACWLAGEVLLELGTPLLRTPEQASLLDRVRSRLVQILREERLPTVERAEAGDVLGSLGDPRFDAGCWGLMSADYHPALGFVRVPAGPFLMGSADGDEHAGADEKPRHRLYLDDFYVASHLVTVDQYRQFANAGHVPEDERSLDGPGNRPVVFVTWREALAYCEWLTESLRLQEGASSISRLLHKGGDGGRSWRVALPSEAEWEKAARVGPGGWVSTSAWSWGDDFTIGMANTSEAGLRRPTSVGCYPRSASGLGVQDLSGNVWEWTRSLMAKRVSSWECVYDYPYVPVDGREDVGAPRVRPAMRGGSCRGTRSVSRCSTRRGGQAGRTYDYVGFRTVVTLAGEVDGSSSRR